MADRYPLVYNPSANQLQELQSGDSLDAGGTLVKNAVGYSTAGGTSSQFLKADGSVDSNTYLTSVGTVALAQGLTGSPNITVSAVSGTTGTFSSAVSGTNGTFSGNVSAVNVSASSSVTAATFYGDGQNLTNTGSTLSASSGTQRVVLTGQTSGTMTSSATDSDFTYDSSTNTLNVLNLNVQGTTTTIDTAVTAVDSLEVEGSVGIGTTNPDAKTHIDSTTSNTPLVVEASQTNRSRIVFRNNVETGTECNVELIDEDLRFVTNSGERLRVKKDGNIGIGVTDPSEKLEVRGGKIFIDGGGNRKITLDPGSNTTYDSRIDASHTLVFRSYVDAGVGVKTCTFNTNGHLIPGDDNGQDLGASNARWRNIYTGDLNLSNEGSANDVDGTWGQYTIQEGEDDLFLINRRTGKKYKFNLTEVN